MISKKRRKINIVIADSHHLFRKKLREILTSKAGDMVIISEVDSGSDIENVIKKTEPDLLFLDMDLIIDFGLQAIKLLKEQHKNMRSLLLSDDPDPGYRELAHYIGAHGVFLKERIVYDLPNIIESFFIDQSSSAIKF